jgi:hypothetical protein
MEHRVSVDERMAGNLLSSRVQHEKFGAERSCRLASRSKCPGILSTINVDLQMRLETRLPFKREEMEKTYRKLGAQFLKVNL